MDSLWRWLGPLNWLDIIILLVLAGAFLSGLGQGLIRQTFSVAALLGGTFLAGRYYGHLTDLAGTFLSDSTLIRLVSFAAAFFLATVLLNILASIAIMMVVGRGKLIFFGWADRLAGAMVGLIGGLVFCAVAFIALTTYPVPFADTVLEDSALAPLLFERMDFVLDLLPDEFHALAGMAS